MDEWTVSLQNLEFFTIMDHVGDILYGCDQDWYKYVWKRMSGCGPSVASNLLLYLHRSKMIRLPFEINNKPDCIRLMDSVWRHVTPKFKGVYMVEQFSNGIHSFTQECGYRLQSFSLNIPKRKNERPEMADVVRFIQEGLLKDCPVAFLNLNNGLISHLDQWHWVTIVALNSDLNDGSFLVKVFDGAKSFIVDLKLWYETTTKGGGFVYFVKESK